MKSYNPFHFSLATGIVMSALSSACSLVLYQYTFSLCWQLLFPKLSRKDSQVMSDIICHNPSPHENCCSQDYLLYKCQRWILLFQATCLEAFLDQPHSGYWFNSSYFCKETLQTNNRLLHLQIYDDKSPCKAVLTGIWLPGMEQTWH